MLTVSAIDAARTEKFESVSTQLSQLADLASVETVWTLIDSPAWLLDRE